MFCFFFFSFYFILLARTPSGHEADDTRPTCPQSRCGNPCSSPLHSLGNIFEPWGTSCPQWRWSLRSDFLSGVAATRRRPSLLVEPDWGTPRSFLAWCG
uniref:Putative secreted protein n=1 Tax=Rhipicephalus microplus TaxID=6941 RepID=A0A6M2D9V2_RHIMP